MLDDDTVDAERYGLIDHVSLKGGILTAVEDAQVNAQRLGLVPRRQTGRPGRNRPSTR
jgi:hypothetical protein